MHYRDISHNPAIVNAQSPATVCGAEAIHNRKTPAKCFVGLTEIYEKNDCHPQEFR